MLDDRLRDVDIVRAQGHWEMHFDAQQFQANALVDGVRGLARVLVGAVHLLRELEANGLVILYDEAPFPNPARFGGLVQGRSAIPAQVYDARVNRLLDETAFSSILVQIGLVAYVRDGFRMPDEVRADQDLRMNRRNLRMAAWALVLSVMIDLWQVCLAYREVHYGQLQFEGMQQVELDSTQYGTLLHRLETACKNGDHHVVGDTSATNKICRAKNHSRP